MDMEHSVREALFLELPRGLPTAATLRGRRGSPSGHLPSTKTDRGVQARPSLRVRLAPLRHDAAHSPARAIRNGLRGTSQPVTRATVAISR